MPPLITDGPVAEFFLNNGSVKGEKLRQFRSNPIKSKLPGRTGSDSWERPQVRGITGTAGVEILAKSIDKVCQGPLYKEVLYDTVNMSGAHKDDDKDAKSALSTLPPFQDKGSSPVVPDLTPSPSPKYRLVRRPAMCLRCKQDRAKPNASIGISPVNGSVNENGFVTPPNSTNTQLAVTLPKTSTPKRLAHSCARPVQPKMVHFASPEEPSRDPLCPPAYRQPPLPLNLDESLPMVNQPRPQPLGRESHDECEETFLARIVQKDRSESLDKVNTFTPEKVVPKTDLNRLLGNPIKKNLFEPPSSQTRTTDVQINGVQDTQLPSQLGEEDETLLRNYLTVKLDSSIKYDGCVQQWLKDIRTLAEAECLNVLQSKTLTKDPGMLAASAVRNAQDTIASLQRRIEFLLEDFEFVLDSLTNKRWPQFCEVASNLVANIQEMLRDYHCSSDVEIVHTSKTEVCLKRACEDLEEFLKRNSEKSQTEERKATVKRNLLSVLRTLQELGDVFTIQELSVIVKFVEDTSSVYCLQMAMAALAMVGQTGEATCQLVTKAGGIRALLTVCVENKWRPLRAAALRILTIICCVPDAIKQLEKAGGLDCLVDVLCEPNLEESVRSEAAGLLAQITAPWMDCEGDTLRGLVDNMGNLVRALTDLARKTQSSEVILLTAAALANLSFLDAKACNWFRRHGTLQVLIGPCTQNSMGDSLFIKDQVATVLANMAAVGSCKAAVVEAGALVLLMSFLQVRPAKSMNQAELSACERVQQKSAIALSRLCGDVKTATTVTQMQGVKRLVKLCKDCAERNNSDSVLVAALATLRKIAAVCGVSQFQELNAIELIEPKLWDSFLIYCSKQESYV